MGAKKHIAQVPHNSPACSSSISSAHPMPPILSRPSTKVGSGGERGQLLRERRACRLSLSGRRRCNAHTWALAGLLAMGREDGGGGGHVTALLGAQRLHGSGAGEQQQTWHCVVGVALLRWCWQGCGDGRRWGG